VAVAPPKVLEHAPVRVPLRLVRAGEKIEPVNKFAFQRRAAKRRLSEENVPVECVAAEAVP
jgi:hypothetical protein